MLLRVRTPGLATLFALTFLGGCPADDGGATGDATDGASSSSDGGSGDTAVGADGATTAPDTTGIGGDGSSGLSTEGGADSSSSGADTTGANACIDVQPAIVTDIDATLTTSDNEFVLQLADGNYDPKERAGGSQLINGYAERGYRILYLTARSETLVSVTTGESARELTERWLMEHGYPVDPETTEVVLSPMLVVGAATADFKTGALTTQQDAGWRFDYAYGNASTDITAYLDSGIPLGETFIIGANAGDGGTVAIPAEDWVDHTTEQLPTVPGVCEAA